MNIPCDDTDSAMQGPIGNGGPAHWALLLQIYMEAFIQRPSRATRFTLNAFLTAYEVAIMAGDLDPPTTAIRH